MMYSSGSFKTIKTYTYTYVANKEGVYNIDNIRVRVNNNTYVLLNNNSAIIIDIS